MDQQNRIVEIISAADKNIECLEHVLFQKEKVKRGLMQDLLTGKVRTVPK